MTDTLNDTQTIPHDGGSSGALVSQQELVSVVIPAYNAAATLDRTLRSVRGQTHRNLEIVVVDDGSTDGTAALVRTHADRDGRVRLLTQPNSGVAAARNLGWKSARSDLIAFLDADDLWAPTKVERQVAMTRVHGPELGLVYTWFDVIDENDCRRYRVGDRSITGWVLKETMLGNFVGHGSSPLVRREALEYAGGFDSDLRNAGVHGCEDWLLYFRIATRYTFAFVPDYLTGYRVVPCRMSSDRVRMLRSLRMVGQEMLERYPEHHASIETGIRRYLRFLIGEALAFRDYSQVWPLIHACAEDHPLQYVFAPAMVFLVKVGFHLRRLLRLVFRGPFPLIGTSFLVAPPVELPGKTGGC